MARFAHEKIQILRGRKTQTDLASSLRAKGFGTTQTTVSRWESGQAPRASVLPALAAELGVGVDDLFTDDDEEADSLPDLNVVLRSYLQKLVREETARS